MASADDLAYKKSVRNMSLILAAIVLTVFAAIFIPPYVSPQHNAFRPSVSYDSPFGFVMHLTINSTEVRTGGGILLTGWLNNTSSSIENVTAASSWAVNQNGLWERLCTSGWPIGLGVMKGHYTQDNYTLGTLVPIPRPLVDCPVFANTPNYFLFEPHSSKALVTIGGTPALWNIETSFGFRQYLGGYGLQSGVYTAVLADEWGDVLTTNFFVT